MDEIIDLNDRSSLERQIVGALRSAIHAHGPITNDNASSAAKRVIGVIKVYNRNQSRAKKVENSVCVSPETVV